MESPSTSRRPTEARPRNREAQEPEEFANRSKACQRCGSTDVKFKYLNNKKQPRYECRTCRNGVRGSSLFNPFPMRPLHRKGYLKIPALQTMEFMVQVKVCPRCKSSTHVRFLDHNNKSPKHPQYRFREWKLDFSPFSPFKLRVTGSQKGHE
ncbi:uncharacterized protein [Physcomitrium patens]|uniref:Dof-type domain-containing protein n=1 Tax=Physcomitrium patens TaxID=3218 RepID=A0A2K1J7G7_PHYPA|nr:hypothetical protein PHYPA_020576 [Physcomitrium patens]